VAFEFGDRSCVAHIRRQWYLACFVVLLRHRQKS